MRLDDEVNRLLAGTDLFKDLSAVDRAVCARKFRAQRFNKGADHLKRRCNDPAARSSISLPKARCASRSGPPTDAS